MGMADCGTRRDGASGVDIIHMGMDACGTLRDGVSCAEALLGVGCVERPVETLFTMACVCCVVAFLCVVGVCCVGKGLLLLGGVE